MSIVSAAVLVAAIGWMLGGLLAIAIGRPEKVLTTAFTVARHMLYGCTVGAAFVALLDAL